MSERAGLGNAMLYLLTGDEFDAPTAYRLNFVQKVVPNAQVLDEAVAIARRIAEQAPLAVTATRLNAIKAVEEGPAAAVADFPAISKRIFASEDWAEGGGVAEQRGRCHWNLPVDAAVRRSAKVGDLPREINRGREAPGSLAVASSLDASVAAQRRVGPVSYTHLTLPTICSV